MVIREPEKITEEVLPVLFKQKTLKSFIRQVLGLVDSAQHVQLPQGKACGGRGQSQPPLLRQRTFRARQSVSASLMQRKFDLHKAQAARLRWTLQAWESRKQVHFGEVPDLCFRGTEQATRTVSSNSRPLPQRSQRSHQPREEHLATAFHYPPAIQYERAGDFPPTQPTGTVEAVPYGLD